MKYIELDGSNIKDDIEEIKRTIDNDNDVVFVYSGTGTLYDYIDALYNKGRGLDADYLYKFKVCYEKKDLMVSYSARNGKRSRDILSMSSLINEIDVNNPCRIVVENNERVQLAFIVQQLIFIDYPLEMVDILLRKEEKDADKTKRFMKNVDELLRGCESAISCLTELKQRTGTEIDDEKKERIKDIDDALASCKAIKEQIKKSINVELKFAVAASKKAGKSVIVNCFLGEQIAPTSTELATPNNCFYKKSHDNMYHLRLEGSEVQDFASCEEIYDVINGHFRSAQNNKDEGFALPNMHIDYVTDENNFSSYTIFDTAGPDAAGTFHADVAEKAMQMCDVAVFAIDYSKYLTTSEEEYLHRVKDMFTAQNKFHSLIFALNKIDVRYTDVKSPKSFVMSVDFLKTRLANIDEAYRDCIIFPTCSLEYFSAIEAEKAGVTELNAENNPPIDKMKHIKFAHKDVPALAWLHTHSENLEYYHGIQNISYDVFKKDSGMPALMSYVSYIAQGKARDEIINNVTFEISSQKTKLQSILDYIVNIEKLINADDEKISQISGIITDYTDKVQNILSQDFNKDDLEELDESSILKNFDGNYKKVIEHQRAALKPSCEKKFVAEAMYAAAVEKIWTKIDDTMDGNKIDNLFTAADFKKIANDIAKQKVEDAAQRTFGQLRKVSEDVKKIVEKRQRMLCTESDACRERLVKEDIKNIELPDLPEFEFASTLTPPSDVIVKVSDINFGLYKKLVVLFNKKWCFANIGTFFSKIFGSATEKDYKLQIWASKQTFLKKCEESFKTEFKNAVYENNIAEELKDRLTESVVDQYMTECVAELEKVVASMNDTYKSCIERFRSAVDDRDKYKENIELHDRRKANIMAIGDCTSDFMDTWNIIIRDFVKDEDTATEKTFVTI